MDIERFNDHISQGIALMTEQKYEAARKEFEAAISIDVKSYEAYIHLGNACANLGQFDDALSAFKNALVVEANSGEALYSIANIYLLKEERLKAVEFYNKAEEAGFKRAELYQILAGIFFDANDIAQALRNITRAIAAEPFDGDLRLFKARIYLADNKYDEALDTLDEMQKVLPDAFEAYDLRAQIYSGIGKYDEALKVSEMGCQRFPEDAHLALTKLKVLVEMNKDQEAADLIDKMKRCGQFDKVMKEAVIQESILFLRKQDTETTLSILQKANTALGGDTDILYLIMDIYGKSENYEKTIEIADLLIGMNPGEFYESTARYFHAHSLDKLGKETEAKAEYRKLTSILRKATINNPSFYEGYIYRLLSHTRLGEFDKALELADYMENLYPDRADAHAFRHFIYKEQGDSAKAEESKNAALKINPGMSL